MPRQRKGGDPAAKRFQPSFETYLKAIVAVPKEEADALDPKKRRHKTRRKAS